MPASKTRHLNTPKHDGRTRCGRRLASVEWRNDPDDVDCNRCLQLHALDHRHVKTEEEMAAWRTPDSPYSESSAGFTEPSP